MYVCTVFIDVCIYVCTCFGLSSVCVCVCVCVFCAWCIMLGEGGGECITLCSEAMYDNRL